MLNIRCFSTVLVIGLISAGFTRAASFTVNNLADSPIGDPPVLGSLRQVIEAANALSGEVHTIEFSPALEGELRLLYRLPEITFSGMIEHSGPGRVTLTTETSADWIFFANYGFAPAPSGSLTLRGLDIKDASVTYSAVWCRNGQLVMEDGTFENIRGGDVVELQAGVLSPLIRNCAFVNNRTNGVILAQGPLTLLNNSFSGNRPVNSVIRATSNSQLDLAHNSFVGNTSRSAEYGVAVDVGKVANEFPTTTTIRTFANLFDGNLNADGGDQPLRTIGNSAAQPDASHPDFTGDARIHRLARWSQAAYLIPRPSSPACAGSATLLSVPNPIHDDLNLMAATDARGHTRPASGVHRGAVQVFSESVPAEASPLDAEFNLRQTVSNLLNTPDPLDFIFVPAGSYPLDAPLPAMATPVVFLGPELDPGEFPQVTIDGGNEYPLLGCSGDGQGTGKEFGADGLHLLRGSNPSLVNGAGGFSTYDKARNFLRDTVFESCSVSGGNAVAGAISIRGGVTRMERCVVHQNVGSFSWPGGLRIGPSFPESPAQVEIVDSIFTGNTTDNDSSAAIDVFGSHLTLTHSTIRNNVTSSGASPVGAGVRLVSGSSSLSLINTVINGNLRNGSPDDVLNDGSTTAASSMVSNSGATFANFNFGALALPAMPAAGSAVINAASADLATADDYLRAPRNAFGLPDIGALEYFANAIERDHARLFREAPCEPVARMEMLGLDRDPDGDGFPTWLEVISGTDPLTPGITPLTGGLDTALNRFEITVPEFSDEIASYFGINWVPNRSFDLATWLGSDNYLEMSGNIPGKPGYRHRTVFFANFNPANQPRQFFRLELTSGAGLPSPCLVGIGEPNGNAGDPDNGFGEIAYPFAISQYEVTNAEFAAFLRVVDPEGENALGLFVEDMELDPRGGIMQAGKSYLAKPGRESHPVNFITYDAARRYCNWLHNGAKGGAETETGAYDLNADGPRQPGAKWFLPTFDEFYKAAYFITSTGPAPAFAPIYTDYPTGNAINTQFPGDEESANIDGSDTRPVGSYAAPSIWGAYDMAGNVGEILESPNSAQMTTKGGSYQDTTFTAARNNGADFQLKTTPTAFTGFRVATRPPQP